MRVSIVALGRVPSPLQPDSGALDVFGGAVATYQTLDYQLDAQLAYRRNGEANGFRTGDEWRLDASLQYRLWPRRLGSGPGEFNAPGAVAVAENGDLLVADFYDHRIQKWRKP